MQLCLGAVKQAADCFSNAGLALSKKKHGARKKNIDDLPSKEATLCLFRRRHDGQGFHFPVFGCKYKYAVRRQVSLRGSMESKKVR
jgi:hypothetical protein